jgi:2-polyprenyl-6-methoxyphenol hydroxylase-like FAD-dependent oxidoreductase
MSRNGIQTHTSATTGLRRRGHEVLVLERASRIDPVGAGLTLFANAMSALARLGLRDAVAAQGAAAKRSAILTREGRELAQVPRDLLEGTIAIHRADLQRELAAAAGEVRLGTEITAVEQHDQWVVARDADGSQERGDLLVGADGLSSVIRSAIADVRPRYAGYRAWRGVSHLPVEPGRLTESWASASVSDSSISGAGARTGSRPRTLPRRAGRAPREEGGDPAALLRLAQADRRHRRGGGRGRPRTPRGQPDRRWPSKSGPAATSRPQPPRRTDRIRAPESIPPSAGPFPASAGSRGGRTCFLSVSGSQPRR